MDIRILYATFFLLLLSHSESKQQDIDPPVITKEIISWINEIQSTWTSSYDWVQDMTLSQAKLLVGTFIEKSPFPEKYWEPSQWNVALPESLDSRSKWSNCTSSILNQGLCSGDWAYASTEVLSNRFCITSSGKSQLVLSPQYLISCDTSNYGCGGGYLAEAWSFMKSTGVPTLKCVGCTESTGTCPSSCNDGTYLHFYQATDILTYSGPTSIQLAILNEGPVVSALTVYQDFLSYKGGIYTHTWGGVVGGYAVKIVGWGNQNGLDYWIAASSWGSGWGMNGYFNIAFGQCGIDNQAIAGMPVLNV